MPAGALLSVLGFLPCRSRSVRTGYILFLLGLGLHLIVLGPPFLGCPLEDDAAFDNLVDVVHAGVVFSW